MSVDPHDAVADELRTLALQMREKYHADWGLHLMQLAERLDGQPLRFCWRAGCGKLPTQHIDECDEHALEMPF